MYTLRRLPSRVLLATLLSATAASSVALAAQHTWTSAPSPARARWIGLIGEYDTGRGMRLVREDSGHLEIADTVGHIAALRERSPNRFAIAPSSAESLLGQTADVVTFARDATGRSTAMLVGGRRMPRRNIEPRAGTNQLRIAPLRPVSELRAEALRGMPPRESGRFRPSDLVDLTRLDPTIKLEIRYATTNNFLGTRFYDQARAFLQRPAAEAVVRANAALHRLGYGILVHDAYRPWYVTKMFWDATPPAKRWLVADPAHGSRHNRGAAVDLTLYDLHTGRAVSMPSTYDESTDRAFADYPGGTSRQRWHRALLRHAMEAQGFTVNPQEWWHFDYRDWQSYAIGNVPFEKIAPKRR
jgi:D-alanyl-D-alanine dipeptidase